MKKHTVRSHYLPKTYLKYFLEGDKLFMYKKGEKFFSKKTIKPEQRILEINSETGLDNIGIQKNLYNPKVDGISSDDLEEIFREYGENFYNEVISEIKGLSNGDTVSQNIKDKLSLFFASMKVRTPLFKSEVEEIDSSFRKYKLAKQIERMTPNELVVFYKNKFDKEISVEIADAIKQRISNKEYELEYPNAYFIKIALKTLEVYANIFHQMTWNIYKSDRFFITSDNPLVYFVPKEHLNAYVSPRNLENKYCEVYFSLSKNIGVILTWKKREEKKRSANRRIVDMFNFNIGRQSLDYIFSPTKMNSLKEYTKNHIPYPFKITMS